MSDEVRADGVAPREHAGGVSGLEAIVLDKPIRGLLDAAVRVGQGIAVRRAEKEQVFCSRSRAREKEPRINQFPPHHRNLPGYPSLETRFPGDIRQVAGESSLFPVNVRDQGDRA